MREKRRTDNTRKTGPLYIQTRTHTHATHMRTHTHATHIRTHTLATHIRTHTHATHIRTHTQNLDFSHATNIKTFLSGEARRDEQNLSEQNLPERRDAPRRAP
jgi:hypothetical protein